MNAERWLPIPGYEGRYSVSDLGRVRSEARIQTSRPGVQRAKPEQMLKPFLNGGYLKVNLCGQHGIQQLTIHSLVALAFIGPRPAGMETCHWDDEATNNALTNLRYGTPSENQQDCIRNGRSNPPKGEGSWSAKLTCEQVREIRRNTAPAKQVAQSLNVTPRTIRRIRSFKNWKSVPQEVA